MNNKYVIHMIIIINMYNLFKMWYMIANSKYRLSNQISKARYATNVKAVIDYKGLSVAFMLNPQSNPVTLCIYVAISRPTQNSGEWKWKQRKEILINVIWPGMRTVQLFLWDKHCNFWAFIYQISNAQQKINPISKLYPWYQKKKS